MGEYSIAQQQLLNKLNISNFRELNTGHALSLASEIKNMPVEVQKELISQIPNFCKLYLDCVNISIHELEYIISKNDTETEEIYTSYNAILNELHDILTNNDNLPLNDKLLIIDKMTYVSDKKEEVHKNNQIHRENLFRTFLNGALIGISSIIGGIFISSRLNNKKYDNTDDVD